MIVFLTLNPTAECSDFKKTGIRRRIRYQFLCKRLVCLGFAEEATFDLKTAEVPSAASSLKQHTIFKLDTPLGSSLGIAEDFPAGSDRYKIDYIDVAVKSRCVAAMAATG